MPPWGSFLPRRAYLLPGVFDTRFRNLTPVQQRWGKLIELDRKRFLPSRCFDAEDSLQFCQV